MVSLGLRISRGRVRRWHRPDLSRRAAAGIADLDGWDLARLAANMERIYARWEDRLPPCPECGEPNYAAVESARYCDECRLVA